MMGEVEWRDKTVELLGPPRSQLPDINGPVQWDELNKILGTLAAQRAPGPDGMSGDWLKLAHDDLDGDDYDGEI